MEHFSIAMGSALSVSCAVREHICFFLFIGSKLDFPSGRYSWSSPPTKVLQALYTQQPHAVHLYRIHFLLPMILSLFLFLILHLYTPFASFTSAYFRIFCISMFRSLSVCFSFVKTNISVRFRTDKVHVWANNRNIGLFKSWFFLPTQNALAYSCLTDTKLHVDSEFCWEVVVAQLVEQSLPIPEVRIQSLAKIY